MTVKKHRKDDCPCGQDHAENHKVAAELAVALGTAGADAALEVIGSMGVALPQVLSETAISFAAATLYATGAYASLQTKSKEEVGAMLAEQLKFLMSRLNQLGFEFSYSIKVKQ